MVEHGTPLVDDPERFVAVTHLAVDEASFLAADPQPRHRVGRGLIDLQTKVDMTWWKAPAPLSSTGGRPMRTRPGWVHRGGGTDLAESSERRCRRLSTALGQRDQPVLR